MLQPIRFAPISGLRKLGDEAYIRYRVSLLSPWTAVLISHKS